MKPKRHSVEEITITDVTEEDDNLTSIDETSQALVLQPDENEVEEEEKLPIVDTKRKKEVQIKKKVVKKKAEEEEVEVIVEEENKKQKKRTVLKTKKPIVGEETVVEEVTEILDVVPAKQQRGLPLKTPTQLSETTSETTVSMIGDITTTHVKGNLSVLTFSALEQNEVLGSEKVDNRPESLLPISTTAKKSDFDTIEPCIVSQPQVESVAEEFSGLFKPAEREASRIIMENEGIVVSETRINHSVEDTENIKSEESHASVSMLLHEAKYISETQPSVKEGDLGQSKRPTQAVATTGLTLQESINVIEITQSSKEEKLEDFCVPMVKPKAHIQQTEPLIVSEVLAETKPGKYFPELFVPTESAISSIVSQQTTALTEEINLTEKEGIYKPIRSPQEQFAGLSVLSEDSVVVSETRVHEKEEAFGPSKKPSETVASEDLNLLEGVIVSMVQHQDMESSLTLTKPDTKKVNVQFTKKESLFTQETNYAESETAFGPNETPGAKMAFPSITALETSGVSETVVGETIEDMNPHKIPNVSKAGFAVEPIEPLSITEIKPEDIPFELSDEFKYSTGAASPKFETLESKEVTEVQAQDSEKPMAEFDIPALVSINKTFESKEGISVYQTDMVETEGEYAPYVIPESHIGKTVPTQPLQSIIVEEITPESDVESITKSLPHSVQAQLKHTVFQETVVEETVIGEAVMKQKDSVKPEGKKADVNIFEEQSISVTEVVTDFKEDKYANPELPQECFASQSHLPQKVAIKSEVVPDLAISPFQSTIPQTTMAKPEQSSFESLIVSSIEVAESEREFKKEISPTKGKASVELTEEYSGLTVQEVVSSEQECEHMPQEKPIESKASKSVTPHHTALHSQTLPEINLGNVPKTELLSGRAKVETTPFQEVVVTETNITEIETSLNTIKPELKTATVGIRSGESFLVSEVVAEDKEDVFKSVQLPESRKAILNLSGQEVAEKEEVVELIQEGTWTRVSPVKEQALRHQDTIQLAVASQQVPNELEGQFEAAIKPTEKVAAVSFVEGNVLSVTEMSVVDNEIPLESAKAPKTAIAIPDVTGQDVAITSEVVVDINVGDVNVFKPEFSEAQIKQSTHESVVLRETTVGEKEGEYVDDFFPETKNAKPNIVEGHSTSISCLVTVQDKESLFITPDKPKERSATPNITSQEIAEKTEIILGSSVQSIKHETPTCAQAISEQLPYNSVIQSETLSIEQEGIAQLPNKLKPKQAGVSFEDIQAVSVFEVSPHDETYKLTIKPKPEDHFAKSDISPKHVALSSFVVPEHTTSEVQFDKPSHTTANIEQVPFESLMTSVVCTSEKESNITSKLKLNTKKADKVFQEEEGIVVSEVSVKDKEGELKPFENPKEVIATADVPAQEVIQVSEVSAEYGITELPKFSKLTVNASEEQLPFESLLQTETSVQESEGTFRPMEAPFKTVVSVGLVEEQGIIVTEVKSEDKEESYAELDVLETRKAEEMFIPIEIYDKSEVVPEDSVGEVTTKTPEEVFARTLQTTLHSVLLKETTVGESEAPLDKFVKPFSKIADTNYESAMTSITVDEVSVQEKEHEIKSLNDSQSMQADISFEDNQAITVYEVSASDETSLLNIKPKQEDQFAKRDILPKHVAESCIIIPENTISPVHDETPSKAMANIEQIPFEGVLTSTVSTSENESSFEGKLKFDSKEANHVFEEEKSLLISEVTVEDKEDELKSFVKPKEVRANTDISALEVLQISELSSEYGVDDIPEFLKHEAKAHKEQIPFESLIQTEIPVQEKEGICKPKESPISAEADFEVVEERGLVVTEVVTEDKEEWHKPDVLEIRNAEGIFVPIELYQKSEVVPEDSVGEVTIKAPEGVFAKMIQSTLHSVMLKETAAGESESPLENFIKPFSKVADTNYESAKTGLTVSEITTQENEVELEGLVKPTESLAGKVLQTREIASKSEVVVESSLEEFTRATPKSVTATVDQTLLQSVCQSEISVSEKEETYKLPAKPDAKNAGVSFEEEQGVSITEIVTGDLECSFLPGETPGSKNATINVSGKEVALKTEVVPGNTTNEVPAKDIKPMKTVCIQQEMFDSVITSAPFVNEKEMVLDDHLELTSQLANIVFEEGKGLSVTQVVVEDKESLLQVPQKPKERTATADIIPHIVAEQSEVHSEYSSSKLPKFDDKSAEASQDQVPFESFETTIPSVVESEGVFDKTFIPETKVAKTGFQENLSINISLTSSEDKETQLIVSENPIEQTALTSVSELEAAIHLELTLPQTVGEFEQSQVPLSKANIEHAPHESVLIQTETIVRENEGEFDTGIKPEIKNASVAFETGQSIKVSEVTLTETGSDFTGKFQPTDSKAKVVLDNVQEVAKQIQVLPIDTVQPLEETKLLIERAVLGQSTLESITVNERLTHEHEIEFTGKFKPETKQADVAIEKGKKVQIVTETIPELKEEILAPIVLPEGKLAKPDLISREAPEVSETLTHLSVREIDVNEVKPIKATTKQTLIETPIQEQVFVEERGDNLPGSVANFVKANVAFEEGKSVVVSEVTLEDSEEPYNTILPVSQVAHQDILLKEAAEVMEISTEMQPSDMKTESLDKVVADVDQIPLKSLTQSEVVVQEDEIEFNKESLDKKQAIFSFEKGEGITVTTVTLHDKESQIIPHENPLMKKATLNITSQKSLQTSEVQPDIDVSDLIVDLPIPDTAKREHVVIECLQVTQSIPQEKEDIIGGKLVAPTAKADVEFTEMRQVAEQSEINLGFTLKTIDTVKPKENYLTSDIVLKESIIQLEVNADELEDRFVQSDLPSKRKASIIKDEQLGVEVLQTVSGDKEGIHKVEPLPTQVQTASVITDHESVVQTEVIISSSTSPLKIHDIPKAIEAEINRIPYESVQTSVTTVEEQGESINVPWKPEIFEGVKSVQESQSISITEVITNEKLSEDLKELPLPIQSADTSFLDQEGVVETEVIPQLPVTPLDIIAPTSTVAKQLQSTQHSLIVTTHDTGECGAILPSEVTPASKNILTDVEEHKTTLLITQVHPEEGIGKFVFFFL